ncbi:hypothetical protein [Paenarthrobacter sp. YJN-5]|uniref:hypothetical protein n=1 Tax=Paenarthrobacter sp. YJN-5 TaxID=2735316 RepID=UPI001878310F|nr:hypothetical protein [Paenarthrobacter sp. YJN-5]QOT19329.1 hypothetical protein HMI59_21980 [Paenarthrobacter sp. YJN-5]
MPEENVPDAATTDVAVDSSGFRMDFGAGALLLTGGFIAGSSSLSDPSYPRPRTPTACSGPS